MNNPKDYFKWINNEDNGLVKSKYVNDVKISVKYLPPAYLAYEELSGNPYASKKVKDSLINYYSKSKAFLLTIGTDERKVKGMDIMYKDISDYNEYRTRSEFMNFEMDELISLNTHSSSFKPVLNTMENTYSTTNSRSIFLVFNGEELAKEFDHSESVDLVFNDDIFQTGVNHFVFEKKSLESIPNFIF
jgi:hypothetical protein